jgi:hypothetical protein
MGICGGSPLLLPFLSHRRHWDGVVRLFRLFRLFVRVELGGSSLVLFRRGQSLLSPDAPLYHIRTGAARFTGISLSVSVGSNIHEHAFA